MKYLITFNTDIVRQGQASEWGVDEVLTLGNSLTPDLLNLPIVNHSVFFIPTVFDYSNSLSYSGADLALRILMKYISNGRSDIDIVLMGNETESNFLLHYNYPNILKIPGVHYVLFNKKLVASYVIPQREQLKAREYKVFFDNLGLKIPSSFKSTHSLTNEWCLFKWNSFMGFCENTSSLEGHLYFDYLITLEKLNLIKSKAVSDNLKSRINDIQSGRILVIDDKKGWHRFFKDMFSQTDKVDIHCIGDDFNKLELTDIERRIIDEVSDFNPHIIILDFRLMEDKDAEIKDDMKQISGYQVLAKVLKGDYKNPAGSFGRQVIIFTATSRIENILLLRNGNADGFILKEKPENYKGKEITKTVISKMISTLGNAIDRAKFLIPLNEMLDNLIAVKNTSKRNNPEVCLAIERASQSVRQLTQNNNLNEDILKLVFLDLYAILESLKNDKRESLFPYINSEASRIRLSSEYFVLWDDICEIRRSLAHGDNIIRKGKLKDKVVSSSILLEWTLKLAKFILGFMTLHLK
ncbi:MAG: hypothetical protein HDS24_04100 [Bacteroides sp.]|nr:hypothetical protein [Bacteroidales bacterium]MBD5291241.1 hypothetical protein [Bacteroides sp.]